MITQRENNCLVDSGNIQQIFWKHPLIERLAVQLVSAHVESFIEMATDYPDEFRTFSEAEAYLKSSQTAVEDMVEDLLTDFRDMLYDKIRACKINVKSVKFTEQGLSDADVEVSC